MSVFESIVRQQGIVRSIRLRVGCLDHCRHHVYFSLKQGILQSEETSIQKINARTHKVGIGDCQIIRPAARYFTISQGTLGIWSRRRLHILHQLVFWSNLSIRISGLSPYVTVLPCIFSFAGFLTCYKDLIGAILHHLLPISRHNCNLTNWEITESRRTSLISLPFLEILRIKFAIVSSMASKRLAFVQDTRPGDRAWKPTSKAACITSFLNKMWKRSQYFSDLQVSAPWISGSKDFR